MRYTLVLGIAGLAAAVPQDHGSWGKEGGNPHGSPDGGQPGWGQWSAPADQTGGGWGQWSATTPVPDTTSETGWGQWTPSVPTSTETMSASNEWGSWMPTTPVAAMPSDTAPVETMPSFTTPEETFPSYTAPEETMPSYTAPEETMPSYTAPEETMPSYTAPVETMPSYTVPAETASQGWGQWSSSDVYPTTTPVAESTSWVAWTSDSETPVESTSWGAWTSETPIVTSDYATVSPNVPVPVPVTSTSEWDSWSSSPAFTTMAPIPVTPPSNYTSPTFTTPISPFLGGANMATAVPQVLGAGLALAAAAFAL